MKMKFTKKIATILLSVCLIVPCFSVMALAANGVIFFSDLETSVGDEFTITGTAVVSGDVIGDATIHMTYDPSYMRFEEGDGVNADTDGNLTFKGSGDGSTNQTTEDVFSLLDNLLKWTKSQIVKLKQAVSQPQLFRAC